MSKSKRDYRSEYGRRVARGATKGLSRSQARGHPRRGERGANKKRPTRQIDDSRLQLALRVLRETKSLSAAAREAKISPERLRHYATEKRLITRRGRRWIVRKKLPRRMMLFSDGQAQTIVVADFDSASKIGRFMAAVGKFLRTNDASGLKPFVGASVTDAEGKTHDFETRPNVLYRLASAHDPNFEEVYRIVV